MTRTNVWLEAALFAHMSIETDAAILSDRPTILLQPSHRLASKKPSRQDRTPTRRGSTGPISEFDPPHRISRHADTSAPRLLAAPPVYVRSQTILWHSVV
jgi:hypothetical protein